MRQILVVDDDFDIQELAVRALAGVGEVRCAGSLGEASAEIERRQPDLVLLDVSLPDGEGYQLCSSLQNTEATQDILIVFLTSRSHSRDKISAFRLGADDYVEKPFDLDVLRARVESHIEKRAKRRQRDQVLVKGGIRIDLERHQVSTSGEHGTAAVDLTSHEFRLLHHLASQEGRIFSRAQLMQAVWRDTVVAERTIDSHMSNLRRKLASAGDQIESVRRVGYVFRSR